jgi:hypothetical protein
MTAHEVMAELEISDEEYDYAYTVVLALIRTYGTHGAAMMLRHVEEELSAGNEVL